MKQILEWVEAGDLKVCIPTVLNGAESTAEAHLNIQSGKSTGKLVVRVGSN